MAKDPSSTAAPKKPGRIAQLRTVLQQSKALDPKIVWWMAGAFVLTLAVIVGIGWLVNWPVYAAILGLPLAALAATIVMSRRAEGAAYAKLEGQPGAAGAALTSLRGGWFTSSEPVAVEGARSPESRPTPPSSIARWGARVSCSSPRGLQAAGAAAAAA
jgi:hypothetical protein